MSATAKAKKVNAAPRLAPALEVVPDSDRLVPEGYTALFRPGKHQNAHGEAVRCAVCLAPLPRWGERRKGETCSEVCAWQLRKAYEAEEALKEWWHQLRVAYRQQLEREGRA